MASGVKGIWGEYSMGRQRYRACTARGVKGKATTTSQVAMAVASAVVVACINVDKAQG